VKNIARDQFACIGCSATAGDIPERGLAAAPPSFVRVALAHQRAAVSMSNSRIFYARAEGAGRRPLDLHAIGSTIPAGAARIVAVGWINIQNHRDF
jgi:hypothetical protein